jgi:hypothetical protein
VVGERNPQAADQGNARGRRLTQAELPVNDPQGKNQPNLAILKTPVGAL